MRISTRPIEIEVDDGCSIAMDYVRYRMDRRGHVLEDVRVVFGMIAGMNSDDSGPLGKIGAISVEAEALVADLFANYAVKFAGYTADDGEELAPPLSPETLAVFPFSHQFKAVIGMIQYAADGGTRVNFPRSPRRRSDDGGDQPTSVPEPTEPSTAATAGLMAAAKPARIITTARAERS